jgi:hypothetical protein
VTVLATHLADMAPQPALRLTYCATAQDGRPFHLHTPLGVVRLTEEEVADGSAEFLIRLAEVRGYAEPPTRSRRVAASALADVLAQNEVGADDPIKECEWALVASLAGLPAPDQETRDAARAVLRDRPKSAFAGFDQADHQ